PFRIAQPRLMPGAYPRSRGATSNVAVSYAPVQGLSPLARGNRGGAEGLCNRVRPIPARAGQPSPLYIVKDIARAYPRSRGATVSMRPVDVYSMGLSPLARGNPLFGGP